MAADPKPAFGAWLREYRRTHDLTRAELGNRIGCSAETIHKIETGERRPSRQIAELLAEHLDVVPDRREAFIEFARTPSDNPEQGDHNPSSDFAGEGERGEATYRAEFLLSSRASYSPPTNLRSPLTRLIGRQQALQDIRDYIRRGVRLLTLAGPPGIGKTRLAVQAGLDLLLLFPHGAFFVPLATARDSAAVAGAMLETLGIEGSDADPLQALGEYLRDKKLVLLLDNFEQVIEAGRLVVQLLEECVDLRVIVTSREPLNARGEQRYIVPPLGVPDARHAHGAQAVSEHPSVVLFCERAAAVRPDFGLTDENAATVAAICAWAEGLPLAIELLAAHMKMLSPEQLLERISAEQGHRQLQLLSNGPIDLPDRHRSLRNAIDWSYELLTDEERRLFARFSIFAGGCTLAAAEAVCDAPGDLGEGAYPLIGSLLDKNLIKEETRREGQHERRFAMLESIRHYAAERLRDEGKWDEAGRWHAEYFLALAETADPRLAGADQEIWFSRLECELDNLRAALQWLLEHGEAVLAARLTTSLVMFWDIHSHFTEGRRWLDLVLARFGDRLPDPLRASVLKGAGSLAEAQGDLARAAELITRSISIRRQSGDLQGLAGALSDLSLVYMDQGDFSRAYDLLTEGIELYTSLEDRAGLAAALSNLGLVELYREDNARAVSLFEQSLALRQELEDRLGCAAALCNLGEAARLQGDYERAKAFIADALNLARSLDHKQLILASIGGLATIAVRLEQPLRASVLFGAEEALRETLATPLPESDREEYTQLVDTALAISDPAAFAKAWQQGRALDIEQTLAYALDDEG